MTKENKRKRPELLLPAGSMETLQAAIRYGADAVYLGGEAFGLRARAVNFDDEAMAEGITYAHDAGVKVYVTANVFAREKDIDAAKAYFARLQAISPDALLIADPGMFLLAREICPEIPVHLSTQANTTNAAAFRFWYAQGVRRIVAARELSVAELKEIREEIPEDMEIECFVHGAMCMSYSGRCFLSSMMTGSSANEGACKHPCRYSYALVEEKRPGVYMPVEEDARGTYLLHPEDLCMIDHLETLLDAGVDSMKIEGRMKNAFYVAMCARAYRRAVDALAVSKEAYAAAGPACRADLEKVKSRAYTTGFYFGTPKLSGSRTNEGAARAVFLGVAKKSVRKGCVRLLQRNKFSAGDTITIAGVDEDIRATVRAMYDEAGKRIGSCPHPKQVIDIEIGEAVEDGDVLYMEPEDVK